MKTYPFLFDINIENNQMIMTITIKDQEITLKYGFRALVIYEEIMGETLTVPESLKEILVLFYSIVLSSSKGALQDFTWDDFMDWLDDNPTMTIDFTQWLKNVLEAQNMITEKHAKDVEKKTRRKSSTRSKIS